MKSIKVEDVKKLADLIAEALVAAQCALWCLQAIHNVSKENPNIEGQHPQLMQLIWRSIFDRFYIKIGSVVETSKGAANLTNLKNAAILLCESESELKETLLKVSIASAQSESIRTWRNKSVAHNDSKFDVNSFYAEHKKHVSEYQPIVDELFEALNKISILSIQEFYMKPAWSEIFQSEAISLFSAVQK
jgi:hypothetical protein